MNENQQQGKPGIGMGFVIVLSILIMSGLGIWWYTSNTKTEETVAAALEEERVRGIVTSFGEQLKNVPLTASSVDRSAAIDTHYAPYVTRDLISTWKGLASTSPEQYTPTLSPDRIEITGVYKNADGTYSVDARVVETNSTSATGTASRTYPIFIMLAEEGGSWMITRFDRVTP